ncbi:aminoglycoside phosphotransferase family protein [Paenibacillaceae bacterium WGS1546]|uniref:aminoglycoside phosphotransferase family protein n=1 Tax=Cohnella sp. WGS1546 TaxID=3366810 RepID=UPI00372CEF67
MARGNLIDEVDWMEAGDVEALFPKGADIAVQTMNQGFEAEVVKIVRDKSSWVLKVWSKQAKPDIRYQYRLLSELHDRGLAVSKPIGWGVRGGGDPVLLTSFDGNAIARMDKGKMIEMARILAAIHRLRIEDKIELPRYDFIDYFYPGVREHPDLHDILVPLVRLAEVRQERLIHGDYHLFNLVESEDGGRLTVIDWTNGQLGDPRYDFAWSFVLKRIYVSERYAQAFRQAYLAEHPYSPAELEPFEALACLRWMLLRRYGGVPNGADAMKRAEALIRGSALLKSGGGLAL